MFPILTTTFQHFWTSRRAALALFAGGLLGAQAHRLDMQEADARKKGKRKKKRKHRKGSKVNVAASCPGSGALATGTDSGDNRVAQTFVALVSGPLVTARLAIISDVQTSGDFELRLVEVDGAGTPTDEVLATSAVAGDLVPNERSDVAFTFRKPFALNAGTEYALVLTRPGGGRFAWFGDVERRCPGRPFFSPNQSGPFDPSENSNFDLTFTVFVRS